MTADTFARAFHEAYETTRTRITPWDALPEEHRNALIHASKKMLEKLFPSPITGHTFDVNRQCTKCMTMEWEPGGGPDPCPLD